MSSLAQCEGALTNDRARLRSLVGIAVGLLFLAVVSGLFLRMKGVREVRPAANPQIVELEQASPTPSQDDWPWWRGSARSNAVAAGNLPTTWSASDNVQWKTAIPGRGHSTPCIWGQNLFLTTSDPEQKSVSLLCMSVESGSLTWQTELHRGGFPEIHQKNSYASSSPACDGQFVYAANIVNNTLRVSAVDTTGKISWQSEAGPYSSEWGYGSSPVLHGALVIVSADNRGHPLDRLMGTSWLAALSRKNGKIVWRVKRGEGDSFGSPTLARINDRDQLLLAGKEWITAYDPKTGNEIWKYKWNAKRTANTLAFDDQSIFSSTRQPQGETICLRADGEGLVTDTQLVWRDAKTSCDVTSPAVHDGCLYIVSDDGILSCLNTTDGKLLWKKRLGGNFSSSPLILNGRLYCSNEEGTTFVVQLGKRGEVIAENRLNEGIFASPVVSGNRLFIRTLTHLYCLTDTSPGALANAPDGPQERR